MFISPAFAQSTGTVGTQDLFMQFLFPLLLIMPIMYFLLIRPQQRKMKEHQAMLGRVARGDTVVTTGGLIGKVTKVVDDHEIQVEIADGVRVRLARSGIADVRAKGEPIKAEANK
jgi:preprotein translocase subunit YajC